MAFQFSFVSLSLRLQLGVVLFLHDTTAEQRQQAEQN